MHVNGQNGWEIKNSNIVRAFLSKISLRAVISAER